MADVIFEDDALDEFRQAVDWYSARSRRAATRFAGAMNRLLAEIGEQPDRFPHYDAEFREAAGSQFPYSIIYRELPSGDVQVVAIAHASRDLDYWRGRV